MSTTPEHEPDHPIDPGHETEFTPQNKLVIYLLMGSAFVTFLNETILSVALPTIMTSLNITAATGQWLSTAYMLTMAIVIPMSGWILHRFSTRAVFLTAMSLFVAGTLVSALAPSFGFLLFGRVIQAAGTGVMSPLFMTAIMTLVPPQHRGRVMGNVAVVMSLAPAVGPMIGGLIVSAFDWRAVFWLVLPISVLALIVGAIRLVNVYDGERTPISASSVVLSALAFGGLVYGLSSMGEWVRGDATVNPWIPIAVGALALVAFVIQQRKLAARDAALLDVRVFESRTYANSIVLMALLMAVLFGTLILLPIYLQEVTGLSAAQTGLVLLPGGLLMGLAGPFVGRLYDRIGPRALVLPGAIVTSGSLWALQFALGLSSSWFWILLCHIALSIGLALIFTPVFTISLASVKPTLYSHASAVLGTVQQLAGAAGTAIFVVTFTIASGRIAAGVVDPAAVGSGVHAAFVLGAWLSLAAIIPAAFIPRVDASAVANREAAPAV